MISPKLDEETIFKATRRLASAEDRRAYLDQVCGEDEALRQRVQALLRVDEDEQSFLGAPALGPAVTTDQPAAEFPGAVIGAYKLLEQIGEGGFGVVYMAEQTQPVRRKVALKVLKQGMDTKQVVARFEVERQALALMDHPNIAKVLDAGTTDSSRPYFVMELVRGTPLTEFCDQMRLGVRDRLGLFVQVCRAVQHAHQKGVIHRDLKPTNVLVTLHDGVPVPKVIDFGIAKAVGQPLTDKTLFTGFAQLVGTPLYMSPEQAELSGLDVDTRSDVYSLGVVLYELLTGTTPFDKERLKTAGLDEVRRIIREEEPARPSTRLSTLGQDAVTVSANRGCEGRNLSSLVRGELDWIVMMALEKDRTRRYESASALAADIQHYLADEAVKACPPSIGYRLRKFVRRNKGPVVAASLVVLALVGGIAGTTWGLFRATDAEARAVSESGKKDIALQEREAALTESRGRLITTLVQQARAIHTSRRPGQRFDSLAALRQAASLARALQLPDEKFDDMRNAAVAAMALPDLSPTGPWHSWPVDANLVDFDATQTVYARTDRKGNCSVRRMVDDNEVHHLPGHAAPAAPFLSPDGKSLIIFHWVEGPDDRLLMEFWDLGVTPARKMHSEDRAHYVAFHPSLPKVALAFNDGSIGLFELPDGRLLKRLPPIQLTREIRLALHPTEPVVAVCSYFGSAAQVRDLGTGEVLAMLPHAGNPGGLAWSPDGRTLALGLIEDHKILLFDRATWHLVRTIETDSGVATLSFSPDGEHLVSGDWAGIQELFVVSSGRKLATPVAGSGNGQSVRFGRDSRWLAPVVRDGALGRWEFGDGREFRTLVSRSMPPKAAVYRPAVSRDGRLAAVGISNENGGYRLWDLVGGAEVAKIPLPGTFHKMILFEKSGALLTLTRSGVSRWPVVANPTDPDHLVIGPPVQLSLPPGSFLAQSDDGRVTASSSRKVSFEEPHAGGWIQHADRPDRLIPVARGDDIGGIAVSPDGRWVATVNLRNGETTVWDASDGRLEKKLGEGGWGWRIGFSPDGRWLSTGLDGGRLYEVGTWVPGPRIGDVRSFSSDGKIAVVAVGDLVQLVNVPSGRMLVTLENPDRASFGFPVFTPDGARLIDGHNTGTEKGVCVWDLRLIRQRLTEMGLDWAAPPYPPVTATAPARPLRVEVRTGLPAGPALTREEKARRDIEIYRTRFEANKNDPKACNNLAWVLLTAPGPHRDVNAAVPLAEQAVKLAPKNAVFANTLGAAYYRAGQYREAAEVLRPNLDRQVDKYLAFDLYFLAMIHHRLGEAARARDCFAWAGRWEKTQSGLTTDEVEELKEFRAEAGKLLGIATEAAPPPREKQ